MPATAPAPSAPKPPDWPANDVPASPTVVWDSRGLLIDASNSSLEQILKEVSLDTGVKVEGMSQDQRIFGSYGPGPARDVLSQLLDGTDYDVLITGELGKGTPRQVILTLRSSGAEPAGNAKPPAHREADEAEDQPQPSEEPEAPPEPPLPPDTAIPPVPVRTQQQLMEEMQERQRELQQQQQQNPQN